MHPRQKIQRKKVADHSKHCNRRLRHVNCPFHINVWSPKYLQPRWHITTVVNKHNHDLTLASQNPPQQKRQSGEFSDPDILKKRHFRELASLSKQLAELASNDLEDFARVKNLLMEQLSSMRTRV